MKYASPLAVMVSQSLLAGEGDNDQSFRIYYLLCKDTDELDEP